MITAYLQRIVSATTRNNTMPTDSTSLNLF
jgi:hypothetical protein